MIIGVDVGTSSIKAVLFSEDGVECGSASRTLRVNSPNPAYYEQDLEEIIGAFGEVVEELCQRCGEPPSLLGFTAQGDGLWLLDKQGNAVRPPILWCDGRASAVVENWGRSGLAAEVFKRSGSVLFPGSAAPLLVFLKKTEPESLSRAATAAYCKDAILQRLTGARVTDITDASTPFLNPATRRYDPVLLELYGLSSVESLLAPIEEAPGTLYPLNDMGACLTSLPQGTPVHSGPFDVCASVMGGGIQDLGQGFIILGTTLACGALVDRFLADDPASGMALCTWHPRLWIRLMPAMTGAPAIDWSLSMIASNVNDLDGLFQSSAPGAGGVTVLPFLSAAGERAPFVDPFIRGRALGLHLNSTPADLVRGVCEGLAYSARHCLNAAGFVEGSELLLCGGAAKSLELSSLFANVLGHPVRLAKHAEAGASGAALAALKVAQGKPFDTGPWTGSYQYIDPTVSTIEIYDERFNEYLDYVDEAKSSRRIGGVHV